MSTSRLCLYHISYNNCVSAPLWGNTTHSGSCGWVLLSVPLISPFCNSLLVNVTCPHRHLYFRFGKPAKASLLKYFDIVLPLVFQVAIFRDTPNQYGLIGSGLIVAAVLTVILVGRPGPRQETLKDSEKLLSESTSGKCGSARYTILDEVDDWVRESEGEKQKNCRNFFRNGFLKLFLLLLLAFNPNLVYLSSYHCEVDKGNKQGIFVQSTCEIQ